MNENEEWHVAKAVLRGKFLAVNAYIKKEERSQINNISFHQKTLEKEQINLKQAEERK